VAGERPQGTEDLLRLIARLQDLQARDPTKRATCGDLLARLLPLAEHLPGAASWPAAPLPVAGRMPSAGHAR
jgi:hypothetical protein